MLLNNDTIVADDFIDEMTRVVSNGENIGIAGGKILCHEFPDIYWFGGGAIDYRTGNTLIRGSGEVDTGQYNTVVDVDWICSCYMFISRELLQKVGLLDERFFFGWEDADICVRAVRNGYRVVYVPNSKIWHKGWGVTKKRRLQGLPLYYATRGYLIFMDKHFSKSQLARSWLNFIARFPKVVWDYARITEQWKAPIYILWAVSAYLKMKFIRGAKIY
jgi:GT2 family glycosyltransferase